MAPATIGTTTIGTSSRPWARLCRLSGLALVVAVLLLADIRPWRPVLPDLDRTPDAKRDLEALAAAWDLHVATEPRPKWLSQLVAAQPVLLRRFCAAEPPDPWGDEPFDPWGAAYWIEVREGGGVRLVSAGPDLEEGTADDLWVDVGQVR